MCHVLSMHYTDFTFCLSNNNNNSNNAAKWWPEIPIAVAIFVATVVMGIVCIDMHKKWQAFENAQQQGQRFEQKLSTKVFWQSFWYLM